MQISGLSASNSFSATDVLAIEVNENGTNKTYKLTGATLATALALIGSYLTTSDVVDNLTSIDPTKVLAAPQGKNLNDNLTALLSRVSKLNNRYAGALTFASGVRAEANVSFLTSNNIKEVVSVRHIGVGNYMLGFSVIDNTPNSYKIRIVCLDNNTYTGDIDVEIIYNIN